jgi:hypothetical protein
MKHLSSKPLSREVKCLIYKRGMRPVPTYDSETWTVGKQDENLGSFERKVVRKLYGPYLKMGVGGGAKTLEYISSMINMM